MGFEEIAIVGRGCVLPDALDPDDFWSNIVAGRSSVTTVPDGYWRLPHRWVLGSVAAQPDRTSTDAGGYIRGFESVFDPSGFLVDAEHILGLDPLFHWVLYAARAALQESGQPGPWHRAGLVLGNLSYPTSLGGQYVEHVLLSSLQPAIRDVLLPGNPPRPDARNRFSSGFPAHFAAGALGLGAGAFALDAACASGLYAIKLACDRLHDGTADLMLAGAVSGADSLFLHNGFSALQAISRTGRSRPFHRQADGLVPAEGAGFVTLMRLRDALLADAPIFGVIRGIGLSNDGRVSGLLVPDEEGQERALRLAYTTAGIAPDTVSLVECHATGTPVGDAVEARAMARMFAGCADLPIGSAKSNVGHLLAAAGIGGLLKVLGAMRAGVRPATLHADEPIAVLDGTPLRLLAEPEDWPGLRRAAVSAFGFGGVNAHLIVDAWNDTRGGDALPPLTPADKRTDPVAIVAIGARVADGGDTEDFRRALLRDQAQRTHRTTMDVSLTGLRFPPLDLEQALPQQVLVMEAAREAVRGLRLPRERTMVLIGMGVEPRLARFGARWRVAFWLEKAGIVTEPDRLAGLRDAICPPMSAASVVGSLPNLVANRINAQLDLAGPGFTVSAEEASGLVALELAARAIRSGEADAAVVGAVDLSHDPLHQAACRDLDLHGAQGDAAIVLVVKSLSLAHRDGDKVIALLDDAPDGEPDLIVGDDDGGDTEEAIRYDPTQRFGAAHAAKGLASVAVAAMALQHRVLPRLDAPACPMAGMRTAEVVISPLGAPPVRTWLRADAGVPVQARTLFDHLAAAASTHAERGEVMRLHAHPAQLRLPTIGHQAAAEVGSSPVMPRAEGTPASDADSTGVFTGVFAAVARQRQWVTAAHRDFLARHAETHQAFLRTRGQAAAALVRTARQWLAAVGEKAVVSGPTFDRAQLEHLASHPISELFGPLFSAADAFQRQTRLPQPPMLLVDRVTGIDAEPASMGTGTIWTETEVALDGWYLDPCGRMPPGIVVEAGQADLLLISWLGIDLLTRGERVYRLLGCELTFHGSPPLPGETLRYEIHIDGHARHGDVRLFFFHYDCHVGDELRLTVRDGRAGFFSDAELAAAEGVEWDPAQDPPAADAPYDPPAVVGTASCFAAEAVRAFADGRPADCFGAGWRATKAHVRTPRIGNGRMLLLHEVTTFDPAGGPWGRGYLRAETPVSPDAWFFAGHFKNDPCMPGTLMLEGCLQAMSFYLAALGLTIERDGWRFEPVQGRPSAMRCRGQVTPRSRQLSYEVFVSEVVAGPQPTLHADVLCTVDGVRAFHATRVGMRLVPDWPLTHWRQLGPSAVQTTGRPLPLPALGGLRGYRDHRQVAEVEGIRLDYPSLLACAWGRQSEALGGAYSSLDGPRRGARLPGPPYHFMTRIVAVDGRQGCMRAGSRVVAEYDVPAQAWYFEQNGNPTMPFAVLMEVALQPCGWLAAYVGNAPEVETDLLFRNLDGTGTVHTEVRQGTRTLRAEVELCTVVVHEGGIIESFTVACLADGELVFELSAVFGFFPPDVLDHQVGLPPSASERARLAEPWDRTVDLSVRPDRYCAGSPRLAGSMLLMLDRITGCWPEGGKAGLGRLRAEKDVDPGSGSSRPTSSKIRSSRDPWVSRRCANCCSSGCSSGTWRPGCPIPGSSRCCSAAR